MAINKPDTDSAAALPLPRQATVGVKNSILGDQGSG